MDSGFHDHPGTQTTGAHHKGGNTAIGELMAHTLQIGVETTLGLDIRMADKIASLRLLAAESTFFAHEIILQKPKKNRKARNNS